MEGTAGTSRDLVARAPGGAGTEPLNHGSWRDRVFARMGKIPVGGPWCIAEREEVPREGTRGHGCLRGARLGAEEHLASRMG